MEERGTRKNCAQLRKILREKNCFESGMTYAEMIEIKNAINESEEFTESKFNKEIKEACKESEINLHMKMSSTLLSDESPNGRTDDSRLLESGYETAINDVPCDENFPDSPVNCGQAIIVRADVHHDQGWSPIKE